MRLYAERPSRLVRQLLADVVVVGWVVAVALLASALRELVLTLQGPAQGISDAGVRVRDAFGDAAGVASDIPFVGDRLAGAFGGGIDSGERLVAVGQEQSATVATLASGSAWVLAFALLVPVVVPWLVLRGRWVARARGAIALRAGGGVDLLALRALMRGSPAPLEQRVPGAADGWRRRDPAVLERLAECELRRLGLRGGRSQDDAGAWLPPHRR